MNRRLVAILIPMVVLINVLVGPVKVYKTESWTGTVYIRANGDIEPIGAPVQRNEYIYTLTENISSSVDGIVIERSNIVVDGNGLMLSGFGYLTRTGINVAGVSNVTIKNFKITNFESGILLNCSDNNHIFWNNLADINYASVYLWDSQNNVIQGNNITSYFNYGIYLWLSNNNTIAENRISSTKPLYGAINIWCYSRNNTVAGNVLVQDSLVIGPDCYPNVVHNNTVNGEPVVYLENKENITVSTGGQVILVRCNNIRVEKLRISNTTDAIILLDTNMTTIEENDLIGNEFGISLTDSMNNTILRNDITEIGYAGICFFIGNMFNHIAENRIDGSASGYRGIALLVSESNEIVGNQISNFKKSFDFAGGIYVERSSHNLVYHNNLINNTNSARINDYVSTNTWDNGYPSGGNYWSDLNGTDANADGIGDAPYVIDANNQDNYPLMSPAQAREVFLEVPYQYQGDTNWCGPTSLSMALNYYGLISHPWDYASSAGLLGLGKTEGTSVSDLVSFLKKYYPVFDIDVGNYTLEEIQADQNNIVLKDIESNVSSAYPVILSLVGGSFPDISRHFVVVTGYNKSGLFINDPSGAFFTDSHYLNKPGHISPYIHEFVEWDDIKMFIQPYEHNPILGDHNTLLCVQNFLANPLSGTVGIEEIHWGSSKIVLDRGMLWMPVNPVNPDDKLGFYLYAYNSRSYTQNLTLSVRIVGDDYVTYSSFEKSFDNMEPYDGSYFYRPEEAVDLPTTQYYSLFVELKDEQKNVLDYFVTPQIYYFKSGISATLREQQRHLFLHAYDALGNHVGMNYTTNQTELAVPGSYYNDDENGTITIILPQATNLTVVVDARYAENPSESYNLTVTVKTDFSTFSQTFSSNITMGENQTLAVQVSDGTVAILPEFPSSLILSLFMIATLLAVIVYRKKRIDIRQKIVL